MRPELKPFDEFEYHEYIRKHPKTPNQYFADHRVPTEPCLTRRNTKNQKEVTHGEIRTKLEAVTP
jgi:hypothetical protein